MNLFSSKYRWFGLIVMTIILATSAKPAACQSFMSLSKAVELGMNNNYNIRLARNDSVMANKDITYGHAGMLPSVQVSGNWDKASLDAKTQTILGSSIDKKSAAVNLLSGGLQAQWTLFDGTGMFIEYDKLRSRSLSANLELKTEIENTIFEITSAYCDIIRQQQSLEAGRKKLETSDLRLSVARRKFRSGSGSEQEMLQAEVIRLADTTALTKLDASLKRSKIRLNQLLAVDLRQDFVPEDTITLISLPPVEELTGMALLKNKPFLREEEMKRFHELELKLLRSRQLPRLTLRGSYNYVKNNTEASLINYTRTFGPQAGFTASMNLFDGNNLNRKIDQARLTVENQEIKLDKMEQELTALILEAWYEHQNLLQVVVLGRENVKLAQKNMNIAAEAFATGMTSSLQLREAQEDLFQARTEHLEALFQAKIMETELLRLSGTLMR